MDSDLADLNLPLGEADYTALAHFRRSLRLFLSFSEQVARANGLTPQQHQAILAIRALADENGLSVGGLARHLIIQPHSAAELLNRLEGAGLIDRSAGEADRRCVMVKLTARADRLLRKLSRMHVVELRRRAPELVGALSQLTEHDREQGGRRQQKRASE
jgi:DNA-binding MarR family transcriptional regulator